MQFRGCWATKKRNVWHACRWRENEGYAMLPPTGNTVSTCMSCRIITGPVRSQANLHPLNPIPMEKLVGLADYRYQVQFEIKGKIYLKWWTPSWKLFENAPLLWKAGSQTDFMPLPSRPLPSLSAITHPTKVRWLLQEEERESGGDHSAKYNADEAEREREGGKCTEWAAAKLRKGESKQQGKTLGHIYNAEDRFHQGAPRGLS